MKKILSLGLVIVFALLLGGCTQSSLEAVSTIAIDVNPSVVLELDEDDNIINVILNNEDAQIIVGDMDLIGVDYNIAINALIGSMVQNGYISELTNSVLISISSDDQAHEDELMAFLTEKVEEVLTANNIDGSVITQELDIDVEEEELAELLGISEAKADLILDIIEADPRMSVEELAALSINELNLLLEAKNIVLDNVDKTGNASELGIITVDEAYSAAITELAIDEFSVLKFKVELEQEDGVVVYEVKIETDTDKFKVLINATDGTVYLDLDEDDVDDDVDAFPEEALTVQEIIELVATELSLDSTLLFELEIEEEMDNGVAYYEVEFEYDNVEYELEIDALTGEIYTNSMDEDGFDYESDKEEKDDDKDKENDKDEDTFPENALSHEEIIELVSAELGLDPTLITELELEEEMDNDVAYFEIEFEYEDAEYELEIDALTGEIYMNSMNETEEDDNTDNDVEYDGDLKDKDKDKEKDEDKDTFPENTLSNQEIIELVTAELGLDPTLITELEIEEEMDNDVAYFEIEFEYEDVEYELEVDALSGEIYMNSMNETKDDYDSEDDEDEEYDYEDDYDSDDYEDEEYDHEDDYDSEDDEDEEYDHEDDYDSEDDEDEEYDHEDDYDPEDDEDEEYDHEDDYDSEDDEDEEYDHEDDYDSEDDEETAFPKNALSEDEIIQLVSTELGLESALITELEIEEEMDNEVAYYEIEFEYNETEYELEVDALTGEIYMNSMDETEDDYDSEDSTEDDYEEEDSEDEDDLTV